MWKKNKNKIPSGFSKKNNICQNSQERSVREIGTLARVLSWQCLLKNVILVRKRFLMVPQLESISWCLFQKTREEVPFHMRGLSLQTMKFMLFEVCKLAKNEIHVFWRLLSLQKWNSCFLRFFKLAKNEIHVFWAFLSLQKFFKKSAKKNMIQFFTSLKKLKKHGFNFLQALNSMN